MSDRAEADCQEMLALNADAGAAWTACGYASFFAGRYEEALRRFDSAQPDASDPGAVSFGIAMTHYAMGQTHLAAQAFDKAIESKPKRPDYQFWRYMAWSELGNPDRTELDRHEAAYDWEISSMAIPMIDFQLGRGDEAYAWDHLDLYDDDRGITQATLRCFFEFNLAHKAMVAGNPQEALKHSDAGAAVCTPGEWAFHALKGLSRTLNARLGKA